MTRYCGCQYTQLAQLRLLDRVVRLAEIAAARDERVTAAGGTS